MPSVHLLHQPCNSLTFHSLSPPQTFNLPIKFTQTCSISPTHKSPSSKLTEPSLPISKFLKTLIPPSQKPHNKLFLCSANDQFYQSSATHQSPEHENSGNREIEELELLGKPSPVLVDNGGSVDSTELGSGSGKVDTDEALEPFLRFFRGNDGSEPDGGLEAEVKRVSVKYYEAKAGDFVVGVVVSGNENKLDVNIGADFLGTMLTKEVLPLYDQEIDYLLCDMGKDREEFMSKGKIGVVKDDEAFNVERVPGRPIVEVGTVVFAEVLGRTLSGRPLLSTRRLFRRVAWHRVRQIRLIGVIDRGLCSKFLYCLLQIKQLNEPIEVRITEWNTGGLITRIEGLRAFLPKAELMTRVNNFKDLKENVGRRMFVHISRIDEASNDLIISEKEAWELLHLKEGTLLEGSVKKIFPYGAQVRIGDTNRSGLLHISNISRSRITSITDLLSVDEKVKVLVVKSMFPDKISLSIAELESEPGLFLSNKEKVFAEANEMAKKYREKMPAVSITRKLEDLQNEALPFHDEEKLYSNWQWFKFESE